MRRLLRPSGRLVTSAVAVVLLVGTAEILGTPAVRHLRAAQPPQVAIRGYAFVPPTVTVDAGTTVSWVNDDDEPHTVTTTDKAINSPGLDAGQTFSMTFPTAGTYAYFCSIHPQMRGTVVVR